MAISKILNMKDCGGHFHGKHLKRALDYVMNPDKTQDGRLVGAINCQVDTAFEQMKETKRNFGKIDKRQGYHIILSFKENEVNPDTAFEITQKFVEEYLGKSYEAVFVVHDNTAHVHSHIVFNSVSFVDGKKYRYEKGDWAKYIQPITNRLCQEYGLSIIDVDDEKKERQHESYKLNVIVYETQQSADSDGLAFKQSIAKSKQCYVLLRIMRKIVKGKGKCDRQVVDAEFVIELDGEESKLFKEMFAELLK